MIDFLGRKAKLANANLQRRCQDYEDIIKEQDSRIRELADIIRENDQLIYQMAQKTSWDQQRQLFNQLQVGQEARMKAESDRIGTVLRRELIEVYHK